MKIKQTTFLLCLSIAFFFTSCFGGTTYWIDNPTDQAIEVSIDGETPVTINAKEFKKMDNALGSGEHSMKVTNGQEVKFNLDKDHVILNPTLSTYVVVLQEYGVGMQSTKNDSIFEIDGNKYEGPFKPSNAPFIYSGDINYLIDKPFPEQISTQKSGTVTLKKIFRKADFIEFYDKEYQ